MSNYMMHQKTNFFKLHNMPNYTIHQMSQFAKLHDTPDQTISDCKICQIIQCIRWHTMQNYTTHEMAQNPTSNFTIRRTAKTFNKTLINVFGKFL